MEFKKISIIVLALIFISIFAANANAQIGDAFGNALSWFNDFLSEGYKNYEKIITFSLLFFLLFAVSIQGLGTWFKEKTRHVIAISLFFSLIASFGLVTGTDFTITKYGWVFLILLGLVLFMFLYNIILKFGLENHKFLAFLIALLVTGLILFFGYGLFKEDGALDKGSSWFGGKEKVPGTATKKEKEDVTKWNKNIEEITKKEAELELKIKAKEVELNKAKKEKEDYEKGFKAKNPNGDINSDPTYIGLEKRVTALEGEVAKLKEEKKSYTSVKEEAQKNLKETCLKESPPIPSITNFLREYASQETSYVDSLYERYQDIEEACKNAVGQGKDEKEEETIKLNLELARQGSEFYKIIQRYSADEDGSFDELVVFVENNKKSVFTEMATKKLDEIAQKDKAGKLKFANSYYNIAENLLTKDDKSEEGWKFLKKADDLVDEVIREEKGEFVSGDGEGIGIDSIVEAAIKSKNANQANP